MSLKDLASISDLSFFQIKTILHELKSSLMVETGNYKQVCFSLKPVNQAKEVPMQLKAVLDKARRN